MRHLITVAQLATDETWRLLNLGSDLKKEWKSGRDRPVLAGKTLAGRQGSVFLT
ncbi:MAG: hypothetical protein WBB22_00195 [Anaerolineae bacterium]